MIIKRDSNTRGSVIETFIDSKRTFYFPPYFTTEYTGFSNLRMINDDRVQHYWQVPWHQHKNMEIFGYVVEGSSHHIDSLGNDIEVPAGSVQRMTSGSGIWHTEGNTTDIPNRYLQLWIRPNQLNVEPKHNIHIFTREDKLNKFCNITEKLPIVADAQLFAGIFTDNFEYKLDTLRKYYLYVVSGDCTVNGIILVEGDGLSFIDEGLLSIIDSNCEVLLFDLAP